jgi:hypothetical protein
MNWGLFVLILLGVFNTTWATANHGKQRSNWNGWLMFIATILDITLGFWIAGWVL